MSRRLPVLKARQVVATLQRGGFTLIRQKGSHMVFGHPDRPEVRVTVPDHGSHDIKTGTMKKIFEQANLTIDEFLDLM